MGQRHSKRSSAASTEPLTSPSHPSFIDCVADNDNDDNGITKPAPPRRMHHLSELIDLDELFPPFSHPSTSTPFTPSSTSAPVRPARARTLIQSPSGQELDAYQYLKRTDRPLTVQERRERIMERLEWEERVEGERRRGVLRGMQGEGEGGRRSRREGRRGCCGGWF